MAYQLEVKLSTQCMLLARGVDLEAFELELARHNCEVRD